MKGGHSQRRRFSLQALCVVQSPTSEEEPLGSNGQQANCHHQQSVDGTTTTSSLEEAAGGRCGTPSHRQSRRRRPLSTEPALSSSSNAAAVKPSGRNLAPPAPTTPVKSHYKVVVMGSARAGKTSLVGQFLYAAYSPRYRPTVEDMHTVELDCQGLDLRLDILDTGGSYVFPAMRTLAIKSADGFVLVCASDDPSSLEEAEHCRSQILEVKGPSCPLVVVLNKTDLIRSGSVSSEPQTDDDKTSDNHQRASGSSAPASRAASDGGNFLCQEMVESLVTCDWGHGFVPASAKNNINVVQVFQELFVQAKSRIALSPAVRKRRQSLPARTLIPPGTSSGNSNHPHPQLGHHLSLHGSNVAAAAAANNSSVSSSPTGTSSFAKRNSCTVS